MNKIFDCSHTSYCCWWPFIVFGFSSNLPCSLLNLTNLPFCLIYCRKKQASYLRKMIKLLPKNRNRTHKFEVGSPPKLFILQLKWSHVFSIWRCLDISPHTAWAVIGVNSRDASYRVDTQSDRRHATRLWSIYADAVAILLGSSFFTWSHR